MPALTDRQRVECAIPARLVFGLAVADCFSDPDADVVKRLKDLLTTACREPVADLPDRERAKLERRIERASDAATKEFQGQPAVKVALSLFYFIRDLIDREVLILWEGSAMGDALQLLIPMFEHGFEEHRQDRSAQKQARRLLERLQRQGFYQ